MASQYPFAAPNHPTCQMAADLKLTSLAGALGSVIGYLGSEAAQPYLFERLLWPQRFYNSITLASLLSTAILMPMGGPLHQAALGTLDRFRKKGLYGGIQHGHMLGTAFYPDTGLRLKTHGNYYSDPDVEVRNGLWVNVLRALRNSDLSCRQPPASRSDEETQRAQPQRVLQMVHHLQLSVPNLSHPSNEKVFCEDSVSPLTPLVILTSEITAVGCVILILLAEERCFWFAGYLCTPLVLKLLSLFSCVRREPAAPSIKPSYGPDLLIEIDDYDYGFPLISGPVEVVRQFFRHWGHPIRESHWDRVREIASIVLVYGFVLGFPVGLLSMLWVSQTVQIVWLSYQMYIIVAMHLSRLIGFEGLGRLENNLAYELSANGSVRLHSKNGGTIRAKLSSVSVSSIKEGREVVQKIAQSHAKGVSGSESSSTSINQDTSKVCETGALLGPNCEKEGVRTTA